MPEGDKNLEYLMIDALSNHIDNQRNTINNQSVIIKGMIKEIRDLYITIYKIQTEKYLKPYKTMGIVK